MLRVFVSVYYTVCKWLPAILLCSILSSPSAIFITRFFASFHEAQKNKMVIKGKDFQQQILNIYVILILSAVI